MTRGGGKVVRRAAHIGDGRDGAPAAPTPAASRAGERPPMGGYPLLWQLRALLATPPRRFYEPVKMALLADGHALAAGLVVAAVLANHVRRVLAPWLGQFLWRHPVQAMRLAAGAPHWFVEEQLRSAAAAESSLAVLGFWLLQTGALATTRALLRNRMLADAARGASKREDISCGKPRRTTASLSACLADGYRIVYLTLCLMRIEYAYAEACWAASWLYAATHILLRGTPAEQLFTHQLLAGGDDAAPAHWRGLSLITLLLLWWSWRAFLRPIRRHGLVGVGLSGLPVAVGLVGAGTAHVVRRANKYFIWLEMSEMLLTWAWLALGLALVAVWRVAPKWD